MIVVERRRDEAEGLRSRPRDDVTDDPNGTRQKGGGAHVRRIVAVGFERLANRFTVDERVVTLAILQALEFRVKARLELLRRRAAEA